MKNLFLILGLSICCFSFAQKEKGFAYVELYSQIAIKEMQRTGVPASITLAQGILESRFGESELSRKSNNHFGIKCKLDWTGEKVYHNDDENQECFRKYNNIEESFIDHSNFLKSRPHYASLFSLNPTDFIAWAKGLKKAGYATEINYPSMLIKIIDDYNLNQYTLIAINKTKNNLIDTSYKNNNADFKNAFAKSNIKTTVVEDEKDDVVLKNKTTIAAINTKTYKIESYPEGVFSINHTKVFYAKEGRSLLSIALEYNISLSNLLDINDMEDVELLTKNQLVYLEKKQKKGTAEFHVTEPGESLHDIAQKEGVRIEALVEYNNIHKKLNPLAGEKLYLRNKVSFAPKTSLAVSLPLSNNSIIN